MKRKFYLRGLGIGILVTAVIMGIASSRNRQMTDEEIMARAKELGMVESGVLSDMAANSPQGSPAPSQAPENTDNIAEQPTSTDNEEQDPIESSSPEVSPQEDPAVSAPPENTPEASVSPSASPEERTPEPSPSPSASPEERTPEPSPSPSASPEESTPEPSPSPDREQEVPAGEIVTITIRSGQSSVAVSQMLEEAGLVESASAYDKYLCDNGYDKRIKSGTHEIPVGATEEEIARIITSKGN